MSRTPYNCTERACRHACMHQHRMAALEPAVCDRLKRAHMSSVHTDNQRRHSVTEAEASPEQCCVMHVYMYQNIMIMIMQQA